MRIEGILPRPVPNEDRQKVGLGVGIEHELDEFGGRRFYFVYEKTAGAQTARGIYFHALSLTIRERNIDIYATPTNHKAAILGFFYNTGLRS